MIGKLFFARGLTATMSDDGVWHCPHPGYETELNIRFRPKSSGLSAVMPFGVVAVCEAAGFYRVRFELTNPSPRLEAVGVYQGD